MIKAVVFDLYGVVGLESGPGLRLNGDLLPTLHALKSRYRLGLLSNSERSFVDRFLANNDVRPLFDVVLASSQTRFIKPQREIFEIMAERLDLPFSQILFIDDSPTNTGAAHRYGIKSILFRSAAQLETDISKIINL